MALSVITHEFMLPMENITPRFWWHGGTVGSVAASQTRCPQFSPKILKVILYVMLMLNCLLV